MSLTFSNAHLWSNCAGSAITVPAGDRLEREEPSEAAQEGIAASWVADSVLRGSAASAAEFEGEQAPNGWPIDHAMMRHVQWYIDTVRQAGAVLSETELTLWRGLVSGRVDTHAADHPNGTLRVWEFKYGYRIHEPEDNPQLLLPAIALLRPHHTLICLAICQPRPYHPAGIYRRWTIKPAELKLHENRLYQAAIATADAVPVHRPGHHCEFCPRRAPSICSAIGTNLYAAYELMSDTRRAGKLTAGELAAELDFLEMTETLLKARQTGARAEAMARIQGREFISGYAITPRAGKREIAVAPEMVQALTGLDPYESPKLKSPAQLEREGAHPETLKIISHTASTGHELKKWKPSAALKAFKNGK